MNTTTRARALPLLSVFFLPLASCSKAPPSGTAVPPASAAAPAITADPVAPASPVAPAADAASAASAPSAPALAGSDADLSLAMLGDASFAVRLYGKLPRGENVFFSPASVRMALAMTYAGASGATASEMEKTLALDPDRATDDRGFARALQVFAEEGKTTLPPDAPQWRRDDAAGKQQTLRVVNRLWGQRGHSFLPGYLSLLDTSYGAPLTQLDFHGETEQSRVAINTFIADATEQRIKDLLPPGSITSLTGLVLTNAVYFKGSWADAFKEAATKDDTFFVSSSKRVQAKLMTQTRGFSYASTADAQILELDYASRQIAMFVVLPKERAGLAALERRMKDTDLASWTNGLAGETVHVTLPRFTMTRHFSLKGVLASMGMPSAFDEANADFSGMDGARDLYLDDVIHQAFVAVDEKGTEAAAATAGVMMFKSLREDKPPPPIEFRADHPFLFLLKDKKTGSVLFMGRVTDPTT